MEHSEEEKKAIEILKKKPKSILDLLCLDEKFLDCLSEFNYSVEEIKDWACEIVLNLIEKQQKEIEKKNKIITEVERYARGIKDEELLLILKKDEIEKLVNECEELLGDE